MRSDYAHRVFMFMSIYTVAAFLLVLLSGQSVLDVFELPDSVLITIVGSTAVSVIGLVGIVVRGLFSSGADYPENSDDKPDKLKSGKN